MRMHLAMSKPSSRNVLVAAHTWRRMPIAGLACMHCVAANAPNRAAQCATKLKLASASAAYVDSATHERLVRGVMQLRA